MKTPLQWLERLRWGTAVAQCALIGSVIFGYAPAWPVSPMLGVMVVGAVSNWALAVFRRRKAVGHGHVVGLLILDTLLLTVLLGITGGTSSPFSLMYLVPVISASFALPPAMAWVLVGATGLAYGSLFVLGPAPAHHHGPAEMHAHILGMFLAYAFTAPLLVVALTRVSVLRDQAEARVLEALQMQSRTHHLASLATLAAGAAHELSSPLSTILLVAKELERGVERHRDREDLVLIREEVLRCREIINQLSSDAGAGMGELQHQIDMKEVVAKAVERGQYQPLEIAVTGAEGRVSLPAGLVVQMLRRLLGNARDASRDEQPVSLRVVVGSEAVQIEVQDRGTGMTPEVRARCMEPFFTTKAEGEGSGLGLFFVSSVAQHYGGSLSFDDAPDRGTIATLILPIGPEESQ